MTEPTKTELLESTPATFDTDKLDFVGMRGNPSLHLTREQLVERLNLLPPAPKDCGTVAMLCGRGSEGERHIHQQALLTVEGGMPEDRWAEQDKYGPDYQLAVTRSDVAALVGNGQPLEIHGDNLYLHLDLSTENLPIGSIVQMGEAVLRVTPQEHNGCKKWVQRVGLAAMRLNMDPSYRPFHLRGIYLQVIEEGLVRRGDEVRVVRREASA